MVGLNHLKPRKFVWRSTLHGRPPKIRDLRLGNSKTFCHGHVSGPQQRSLIPLNILALSPKCPFQTRPIPSLFNIAHCPRRAHRPLPSRKSTSKTKKSQRTGHRAQNPTLSPGRSGTRTRHGIHFVSPASTRNSLQAGRRIAYSVGRGQLAYVDQFRHKQ